MDKPERLIAEAVIKYPQAFQRAKGFNDACKEWEVYCKWRERELMSQIRRATRMKQKEA